MCVVSVAGIAGQLSLVSAKQELFCATCASRIESW